MTEDFSVVYQAKYNTIGISTMGCDFEMLYHSIALNNMASMRGLKALKRGAVCTVR